MRRAVGVTGARVQIKFRPLMATDSKIETRVLDGRGIAGEIRKQVGEEVAVMKQKNGFAPNLVIIQVSTDRPWLSHAMGFDDCMP